MANRPLPNCRPPNRLCGRGCIGEKRGCSFDGTLGKGQVAKVPGQRKAPKCTPGRTRPCGKVCRSIERDCKLDGTKGKKRSNTNTGRAQFEPKLLEKAAKLRVLANKAPLVMLENGQVDQKRSARRIRLEEKAIEMLLKAAQKAPRSTDDIHIRGMNVRGSEAERIALLRAAQWGIPTDEYEVGAI